MDLSIIVPIYNVEQYVRACIESIYRQGLDEDRFEVILVNDGTRDRSMEVIADIIESHKNIIVINQENQGLSVARNNGIAIAKGDYILMPDSDDLLIENSLKPLLEKALETNVDIAEADYLIMNDNEIEQLSYSNIVPPNIVIKNMTGIELLKELKACYVWNKLYRRHFLQQNNLSFIPNIRFQDIPYTNECYLRATNCIKTNLLLNIYRRGHPSSSAPKSFNMEKSRDLCVAIAATWKLTRIDDITPETRYVLRKNISASFYNLVYRLLNFIIVPSDRVETLRFLYSLAPDLNFSDSWAQRFGGWLSRKAPHLYLTIISIYWSKRTQFLTSKQLQS